MGDAQGRQGRGGGAVGAVRQGFQARLEELGYTPLSTVTWMRLMVHLSRWLGARGLTAADLSSQRVEQYLRERQAAGYARFLSSRSVAALLGFLSSMGVLAPEDAPRPCSESEALLASFRDYLLKERGLAPSTAQAYVLRARRFLDSRSPEVELVALTAADVSRAVLGEAGRRAVGSTQFFVVALRAFLRFCFIHGLVPVDLSAAALTATGRRRPGLPKGSAGPRRWHCWIPVTGERPWAGATMRYCWSCFGWACALARSPR